jgi:prefoldin subunit 2
MLYFLTPNVRLVLNTINQMDAQRKCFRLVGGVLVERTVGEVLPAVSRNKDNVRL